jgi:hypothetical protein
VLAHLLAIMLLVSGSVSHRSKPDDDASTPAGQLAAQPECGLGAPTWEDRHPYPPSYAAWATVATITVMGVMVYLVIDNPPKDAP